VTPTSALIVTSLWLGGQREVRSSETVVTGGVVSATATAAVHVPAFPEASVPVKVTSVVPSGKRAGALFVRTGAGRQASGAEAPAKNGTSCGSVFGLPPVAEHSR